MYIAHEENLSQRVKYHERNGKVHKYGLNMKHKKIHTLQE